MHQNNYCRFYNALTWFATAANLCCAPLTTPKEEGKKVVCFKINQRTSCPSLHLVQTHQVPCGVRLGLTRYQQCKVGHVGFRLSDQMVHYTLKGNTPRGVELGAEWRSTHLALCLVWKQVSSLISCVLTKHRQHFMPSDVHVALICANC